MLDEELAAAGEQLGERDPALGRIENVRLDHPDPRQRAPLGREAVAQARQLLFLLEQRQAGLEPLLARDDRVPQVSVHCAPSRPVLLSDDDERQTAISTPRLTSADRAGGGAQAPPPAAQQPSAGSALRLLADA